MTSPVAGLYTDGNGVARFQAVDRHPDYRRRGLAGTLVHHAGAEGLTWPGVQTLVIVADPADLLERLEGAGLIVTERGGDSEFPTQIRLSENSKESSSLSTLASPN